MHASPEKSAGFITYGSTHNSIYLDMRFETPRKLKQGNYHKHILWSLYRFHGRGTSVCGIFWLRFLWRIWSLRADRLTMSLALAACRARSRSGCPLAPERDSQSFQPGQPRSPTHVVYDNTTHLWFITRHYDNTHTITTLRLSMLTSIMIPLTTMIMMTRKPPWSWQWCQHSRCKWWQWQ